ncbi:unnamed protein product [Blepharisma stoltei]|uniref:Protein kinase domain-containing protein n=1 Tax=Blepharisma stoltei TaxID=1481888 RepID=A0AAU9IX79_9CILI|nr:unnamed protein product [Blepharisma stoltei]
MGICLTTLYSAYKNDLMKKHIIPSEKINNLCVRWRKLRAPETMTPNEFQKAIIQNDDIKLNYKKFYDTGLEIEVIEFLTGLIILSNGKLEDRLKTLFSLYCFEDQSTMTPDEFGFCIEKCLRAICNVGEIQSPPTEPVDIDEFKERVCNGEAIDFQTFKQIISEECFKFSEIFEKSYVYMRKISTILVENPFPVINYLQKGGLFLGKYEIIETPNIIEEISSIYKQKYKHAMLDVKPMLGQGKLTFELIYVAGIQGDKNFRQNYFREIVLKNKITSEQIHEFGELPGGLLYKRISDIETTQMTLKEYFSLRIKQREKTKKSEKKTCLFCMSELETIDLGLELLDKLEVLHNIHVVHSNINPSSIYLVDQNIHNLAFLDLELAIWDTLEILGVESPYFQQLPEDKYDITFRDENFLSPEHKELAEEYRRTSRIPKQEITAQCDIYSIGAILYNALTGKSPDNFSIMTSVHPDHQGQRELLGEWNCPKLLNNLMVSNGMCSFLLKILAKDLRIRYKNINEVRNDLIALKKDLESIPEILMEGLEHVEVKDQQIFHEDYILDLRNFDVNDFTLEYLNKFILESRIPNIRIFGGCLPLSAIKSNRIDILDLSNQKLYTEELIVLSLFLEANTQLKVINLSNNPLVTRHETKKPRNHLSNDNRVTEYSLQKFLESLNTNVELIEFRVARVEIGPYFAQQLCMPIAKNNKLEILDLGFCKLQADGIREICEVCQHLKFLNTLSLSGNMMGNEGAQYVARLIENSTTLVEVDLDTNEIGNVGAEAIGHALTTNFVILRLNIEGNDIEFNESEFITQSVSFNSHYNKLKTRNEKFGEYGHNLIAESLKKWIESHKFVTEKLRARLHKCVDEIDTKLAEILLDSQGNLNLRPIPLKYTYNPGEGTVHFETGKHK